MKEINTVVLFGKEKLIVNTIGTFKNKKYEIFSKTKNEIHDEKKVVNFLKECFSEIGKKVNAVVQKVDIIFETLSRLNVNHQLIKHSFTKEEHEDSLLLTSSHLETAINSVKKHVETTKVNEYPIFVQPVEFFYSNRQGQEVKTDFFPLEQAIENIECIFSITTIDRNCYLRTINLFQEKINVKVREIYTTANIATYLSQRRENGSFSFILQIENDFSNFIISKNGVAIKTHQLELNYSQLVSVISNSLHTSNQKARSLIASEGKVTRDTSLLNRMILVNSEAIKKSDDLIKIIKSFIKTVLERVEKIIIESKYNEFKIANSIQIIGKLEKIEGLTEYAKNILPNFEFQTNQRPIEYL